MSVSNLNSYSAYAGDGVTTTFAITFVFKSNSHVKVVLKSSLGVESALTSGVDFNISGSNVLMTVPPASGSVLLIYRESPREQSTTYLTTGPFLPADHEEGLDKLALQVQELQRQVDRCVKVSKSEVTLDSELDSPVTANNVLAVDPTGTKIVYASPALYTGGMPLSAKGDLFTHTGVGVAALPVGGDGATLIADSTQSTGLRWGNVQDYITNISNLGILTSVAGNALTIAAKTSLGTDATSVNPIYIGSRVASIGNGFYGSMNIIGAKSITIPSGATLGHTSGNAHKIFLYVVSVAGLTYLAVSQSLFKETSLVNVTAISAGATSNRVMYAPVTGTGCPCRLVGVLTSTQTTAGLYASNVSEIRLGNWSTLRDEFLFHTKYVANSGSINTSSTIVGWPTKIKDTMGAMASNIVTVPVTGEYQSVVHLAAAFSAWAANSTYSASVFINGSQGPSIDQKNIVAAVSTSLLINGTLDLSLNAGDTVQIQQVSSDTGHSLLADTNYNIWSLRLVNLT